jgi:hypothetical protein
VGCRKRLGVDAAELVDVDELGTGVLISDVEEHGGFDATDNEPPAVPVHGCSGGSGG